MDLSIARLLIDFGFVVLIWAVQLVIYPSFKYYQATNLVHWHRSYTKRVTVIVLPLMTSQLIIALMQLFREFNVFTIVSMLIIAILWLTTFLIFVPLHQKIDRDESNDSHTEQLVRYNWLRTFLWTLLFCITAYHFFYK
jgi:DMSO reductase anchor subunit